MSYIDQYAFELGVASNDADQRLRWLSTRRHDIDPRATVLVPPGYGRRIHHYSVLARALADNGYLVIRFDLSNHVGYSDGDVADLSMTSIERDVRAMVRQEQAATPELPLLVVAPSLAGRATMRALAGVEDVAGCVLLLPVADVERTITQVTGVDGFSQWRRGEARDPNALRRVVEHDVKWAFVADAIERNWGGVGPAREDVAAIVAPVHAIAAEQDDWVVAEDVTNVVGGAAVHPRRLTVLDATSHDVAQNPPVMRLLMTTTLESMADMIGREPAVPALPDFEQILETVTLERRWAHDEYAAMTTLAVAEEA
jgi:alpha-beta hydrolase superfamily lysophospholipase